MSLFAAAGETKVNEHAFAPGEVYTGNQIVRIGGNGQGAMEEPPGLEFQ